MNKEELHNKKREEILNIFEADVFNIIDENIKTYFNMLIMFKPELLEEFKFENISDIYKALEGIASKSLKAA